MLPSTQTKATYFSFLLVLLCLYWLSPALCLVCHSSYSSKVTTLSLLLVLSRLSLTWIKYTVSYRRMTLKCVPCVLDRNLTVFKACCWSDTVAVTPWILRNKVSLVYFNDRLSLTCYFSPLCHVCFLFFFTVSRKSVFIPSFIGGLAQIQYTR